MSALGQKRTFAVQEGMSALPPKADIGWQRCQVRFVPIADIGFNSITSSPPASKWRLEGVKVLVGCFLKDATAPSHGAPALHCRTSAK